MPKYAYDPRWITARFESVCKDCGDIIEIGHQAFYYPLGKHIYCKKCGDPRYAQFLAEVHDEELIGY